MLGRLGVPAVTVFFLACAGCKEAKGIDVDPLALFPPEANVAFSVRVDPLRNSTLGSLAAPLLRSDAEVAATMDAVGECDMKLDNLEIMVAIQWDVDDGVGLNADLFRGAMDEVLQSKADFVESGVPEGLIDSVKLAGESNQVTVSAKVATDELPQVVSGLVALANEP